MKIIVDGFGGDNAPLEVLKGCAMAVREYGIEIGITGDEKILKETAEKNAVALDGIQFIPASSIIPVEEDPKSILRKHKDSSMGVGLTQLRENNGDAFISAGSTGALIMGSATIVGRIKGIKRPAIATLVPTLVGIGSYLLIDAGGNHECRPEMLAQFAVMGTAYMDHIMGRKNPKVGLLNIGAEETKGLPLQIEAYQILKKSPINFMGNIEPRYLPLCECDVAVTDGFTGNVALKMTEGMAISFAKALKEMFKKSPITMLGAICVKGEIDQIKNKMDTSETGGAPILGVKKPVIKAHGNSDARAFKNAIRQAIACSKENVAEKIETSIAVLNANVEAATADLQM